jgi:hypothetical protein
VLLLLLVQARKCCFFLFVVFAMHIWRLPSRADNISNSHAPWINVGCLVFISEDGKEFVATHSASDFVRPLLVVHYICRRQTIGKFHLNFRKPKHLFCISRYTRFPHLHVRSMLENMLRCPHGTNRRASNSGDSSICGLWQAVIAPFRSLSNFFPHSSAHELVFRINAQ